MILLIDNYDSFTYNLFQYIGEINPDITVIRNDMTDIETLKGFDISHIVISPGPGRPEDAGISKEIIKYFSGKIPVLGVCLGHQAIGQVFGGNVMHAKEIVHGKVSVITHNGRDLFKDIENPLEVVRYHSLVVERESLPEVLEITAESADGEIMAVKHKEHKTFGIQFHPESIYTVAGKKMLRNFLGM